MQTLLPRGVRNNNPGNIRRSGDRWQGASLTGVDPQFVTFDTPLWGVRALMILMLVYYRRYGLNTVRSLINRWAPPVENDTGLYAMRVARRLGVTIDTIIPVDDRSILMALVQAITLQENGAPPSGTPNAWYDDTLYAQAADLALGPREAQ